jgi:RHS repeat-associated protein
MGRLVQKTAADGRVSRYAYDALGRMTAATADGYAVQFAYDAAGRLIQERQGELEGAGLASTDHVLDALGRRTATQLPDGQRLRFIWNAQGRLQAVTLNNQALSRHAWNEFAEEAGREQGDVASSYDYDPAGRLVAQTAAVNRGHRQLLGRAYVHDALGQVRAVNDHRQGTTAYVYDPAGQLLDVQGSTPEHFVHDPAGNLFSNNGKGSEDFAAGGRLLMQGDRHFRYDAAGNLVEERHGKGGQQRVRYDYDAEHRLAAAHTREGSSSYRYDALGRRVAKTTPNGTQTQFNWDGARLLGEARVEGMGAAAKVVDQRWYVYEPDSFKPLACVVSGSTGNKRATHEPEVYHYHLDHLGTPREMTNARGRIVWSARYRAWGALALADVNEVHNPLRFQGQYHDLETGLHYNFQRYYDPQLGRFIHQDPIGLAGGENLYRYAPNPVNWVDPWGLTSGEGSNGSSVKTTRVTANDVSGKSRSEIRSLADSKGLKPTGDTSHPDYPRKWSDPVTGEQRLRLDRGHIDAKTGLPYDDPLAASDHVHAYEPGGGKLLVNGNAHIPTTGE